MMVYAPNGDLFVAQSNAGSILVMRDTNKDGVPDEETEYATGLQNPFGMAFHDGYADRMDDLASRADRHQSLPVAAASRCRDGNPTP